MFGKYVRSLRGIHISGTTFAIWAISIGGSALMFIIPSSSVQNAVQIGSCGALAGAVLRTFARANVVITAAMQLADQLAKAHDPQPPDGVQDGTAEGSDHLATVIELPEQRRGQDRRTEAS